MADILHQLTIDAAPSEIYKAITEQSGLAGWWTRDTQAEAKVGTIAAFGFNQRAVVFRMRIGQLEPDRKVNWHCLGDSAEWEGTTLSFELSPDADSTILRFSHRGWRSTEGIYAICNYDWARYLTSLKSLIETGVGMPHPG